LSLRITLPIKIGGDFSNKNKVKPLVQAIFTVRVPVSIPSSRPAKHDDPSSLAQKPISHSAPGTQALSDRQIEEARRTIRPGSSSESFNENRFCPRPAFEQTVPFPAIGSRSPKIKWWYSILALASAAGFLFILAIDPWDKWMRGVKKIGDDWSLSGSQSLAQTRSDSLAQQSSEPSNNEVANLIVSPAVPMPMDTPIPLGVSVHNAADGTFLVVTSSIKGMKLSAGHPAGDSGWSLDARNINDAVIQPPTHFVGVLQLVVSLIAAPNFEVAENRSLRFEWIAQQEPEKQLPKETPFEARTQQEQPLEAKVQREKPYEANIPQEQPLEGRATPHEAKSRSQTIHQLPPEEAAALLKRGNAMVLTGDFAAARLVLRRAAEAGNAGAAFALAGTYNPITLERLQVHGLSSDISIARYWYEKAKELGSPDALRELQILASKRN
jgi:cell division septation protein DedD